MHLDSLTALGFIPRQTQLAAGGVGLVTLLLSSRGLVNTMQGVRAIPQDYHNVAKVLRLSPWRKFTKIMLPATLPYMFSGYRLSLGIAWLVIVAAEMLTGTPGVGGFLWQEYNSLIYSHILLCILTIGIVGFILDRLMGFAETRLRAA